MTYTTITNTTKIEKIALKSVSKNWAKKEILSGRTPESVLTQLKTDVELQHELSQKAIELSKNV